MSKNKDIRYCIRSDVVGKGYVCTYNDPFPNLGKYIVWVKEEGSCSYHERFDYRPNALNYHLGMLDKLRSEYESVSQS